jgi:membrane protease YdiL (CAAX protease family)
MTAYESDQPRRLPAWGWEDAALLVGAFLPSFGVALGLTRLLRALAPELFKLAAVNNLTFQFLVYLCMVGALYLVVAFKYGQPFWTALGWTLAFPGAALTALAGPLLAVAISTLGVAIHTPEVRDPIREMITGRTSLAVVILFGVVIAPFVEEMFFRGFLFPLVARSAGPWASIILTAVLFSELHGAQYEWAWQQLVLIGLAGVAFGFARYQTRATTASFLVHAGFNAVQFAGFLLTR